MGLVTKSFSVDGIGHKIFLRGWDWSQNLSPLMGLVTKSLSVDGVGHKISFSVDGVGHKRSPVHGLALLTLIFLPIVLSR